MRILSFQIDGFGIFSNVACENLSGQLNIFYGHNEAGKSTCLEFFRAMLTGYPEKPSQGRRSFEPLYGGRPGGSITLDCEAPPGRATLARSPASHGGLRLYGPEGQPLSGDILRAMMGGITSDIYRRVFGFSLEELQHWDKKSDESIRNALYGASFGPGLLPPGEALKIMEKKKSRLFKPRGAAQPLAQALAELNETRSAIRQLREGREAYDALCAELHEIAAKLAEGREHKKLLETDRLSIERRLAHWEQWRQWKTLKIRLDSLGPLPENFPEDADARLKALTAARENREQNLAGANARLRQMMARRDELEPDERLLALLPRLRRLAERKNSCRQADSRLAALEESLRRAQKDLDDGLSQLGPGWSCERIRNTDRSLFAREDMEKAAKDMTSALLSCQVATNTLASSTRETESLRLSLESEERELAALPEPAALLTGAERDNLRNEMALLNQAKKMLQAREKSLQTAQKSFERSIVQTQLFTAGRPCQDGDKARIIESLLEKRETAQELAKEMRMQLDKGEEVKSRAGLAAAAAERIRKKIMAAQQARQEAASPTREKLDNRARALRTLRNLYNSIENEEERKKELEARIAQEKTAPSLKNWASIISGILFLCASCAIFVCHWFLDIHQLEFGNGMGLPINLWAAYVCLLCGVILCASGFGAHGPEKKRQKQELSRLLSRSETCSMRMADLAAQSQQLCRAAGIDNLDPVALDAMEMLLEREKEQLFQEERAREEVESMEGELALAQTEASTLQNEAQSFENAAQQCRRRWHGLMQSLDLSVIPSPESADLIFSRGEAAKMAYENVLDAQREMESLTGEIRDREARLRQLAAAQMPDMDMGAPLEECINRILALCADADAIREKRRHMQNSIDNESKLLKRAEARQKEAAGEMERQRAILAEAEAKWHDCVGGLGLDADLAPETAREAYNRMRDCLDAEDRIQAATQELQAARNEIGAMEEPLAKIAAEIGQAGAVADRGWLPVLEELLEQAENHAKLADRKEAIQKDIAFVNDEIEALQAALGRAAASEAEFVSNAGCSTADEFLHMASVLKDSSDIARRMQDLETLLGAAAPGRLEDFLDSFEKDDEPGLRARLKGLETEITELETGERDAVAREGALRERTAALAAADDLAEMRQKEATLLETIKEHALAWSGLALAETLILEARKVYEKERQPEIIRLASEIFANITDGRWAGLGLDLEHSNLVVLPPNGEPVAPVNLSRGAQEQAYLSLRLAYISQHSRTNEPLPLIMDEVLVNFDPDRARRTARAFGDLAANETQQVLYFTCQPNTVEILKEAFDETKVYLVENGRIQAA